MGASQIAKIESSLSEVYKGISCPDDPPTSCCTLEVITPVGSQAWIQVLPGTVNMAYPFAEDPLELMRHRGVDCPSDVYLVEWAADEYATFGFGNISVRDHATFVDELFVKILGCDDKIYDLKTVIEVLET